MKKLVSIGILGVQLDSFDPQRRWDRWRPTVSLCQQEDLLIDRFELLYEPKFAQLAKTVSEDMQAVSPETEIIRHPVNLGDPWDLESVYGALYDFATSYPFDTENEDYIVHITTGTHVCQICLFLLAESRHLPARLIQTSPPKHDPSSSPGDYRIIDLDLSRYDQLAARFEIEKLDTETQLKSGIATLNESFNAMIREIEQVAIRSPHPILITGPTGAGKSQLARRIYEVKRAKRGVSGSFVEVNCATLRGDGAMSALFGHKKGSFTGALDDRAGLLKAANKGVLFLDEIGELGLDEQAMLLRAIEEKRFLPMGADEEAESDFTLISGTNRDLSQEVTKGRFRDDLLARINLWSYQLPGLSQRKEDIEPNISYELSRYAKDHGRQILFNKEARRVYESFATSPNAKWTGNFRDLNASITRMATLAGGKRINQEIVEAEISRLQCQWGSAEKPTADDELLEAIPEDKANDIDPFDKPQLAAVLRTCRDSKNLSDAGRKLFAVSRKQKKTSNDSDRLRKYLAKFGLNWEGIIK
ncbi:RNA repair transcriptional activator RtcR [Pelagicoccus sp. SDUM812003]|uniref:RNA repair transcriptional activator RtcR n=1 Tax=Pelagicoccus sp. SDUM812003 TaxID=3041267 RepID=UPI00280F9AB8|nr:RNA repair transcriptional activator RtcR [Pelagicoccus sp. SDUM812003]MDQ8205666.1 RNA repair transcriptional activator RtcR [Pelagicoccus sp. SDUM812003]